MNDLQEIWVYLSGLPLFSLVLTLLAYEIGLRLHLLSGRQPLVNPVAIAILIVLAVLVVAEMPYEVYFEGAQFIHFLLGTATVALAVPIAQGWPLLKGRIPVLLLAMLAGGTVSIASASVLGLLLGLPDALLLPLVAKSVTAPIAMGIVDGTGISPTLTAIYAVLTGILGAISVRYLLDAIGMQNWADRGFALGIAAHGIGTSRAFSVHPDAGAFASIAMGLHGIAGAILIPPLLPWLRGLLV
ncbi:MAG: LrgB family protein [Burkholderiaceae bacterium]